MTAFICASRPSAAGKAEAQKSRANRAAKGRTIGWGRIPALIQFYRKCGNLSQPGRVIDPILVESAFAAQNLDAHGLQFLQRTRGCDARQGTGLQFLYGLICLLYTSPSPRNRTRS